MELRLKRLYLLILLSVACGCSANESDGKVTDELTNEPIPFATIVLKIPLLVQIQILMESTLW